MRVGDVWRKAGPADWWRVERIQMPDFPGYDGGLPGASVRFTLPRGKWSSETVFIPANNPEAFERRAAALGSRELVRSEGAGEGK